jgi:molecular chaperone GrpE
MSQKRNKDKIEKEPVQEASRETKEAEPGAESEPGTEEGEATEPGAESETEPSEAGVPKGDGSEDDEPKEEWETRYLRLAADFDNFRKRTAKEKSDIYAHANEKFAVDLLDVLDNFERAINQNVAEHANETFTEGMQMILTQFMNVLLKNDVMEIEAVGAAFDPNIHHAVVMEASEKYESGTVTEVLQKGYKLKEKVIRPAMVKVAQ